MWSMPTGAAKDVTQLLLEWSSGDRRALDDLTPLVYAELRRLARSYMRRERPDHTLQTTALVHEAYVRLVDQKRVPPLGRAHFFGAAAQIMRRILIDHARGRERDKRGGNAVQVSLDEALAMPDRNVDVLALNDALNELAAVDARQSRIVELRFFGGLSIAETAKVMG